MDFTLFLFLEITGIFFLIYGMHFSYQDVRAGMVFVSTLIFYMLSTAAWNITRDYAVVVAVNGSEIATTHTITHAIPEMSALNTMFMWISILWVFFKVLRHAEEITSILRFEMSTLARRLR